ncbi:unnamed protein product [Notodromas monacha]|uniref:Ig-like domain-containing protein n=1 Tax=Notodromas monacha TaxID=399045 RepID=A0A7R9GAL0_9CRUS|nr:unnamed protein product [Notodromas monacha]CAG0915534.1 unnamed protein product [Notodromas monacha]
MRAGVQGEGNDLASGGSQNIPTCPFQLKNAKDPWVAYVRILLEDPVGGSKLVRGHFDAFRCERASRKAIYDFPPSLGMGVVLMSNVGLLLPVAAPDLGGNAIQSIESLAFQGLKELKELFLDGNGIENLNDGAFFGLGNLKELYLDNNNVSVVSKGWLYGLNSLRILTMSSNAVAQILDGAWEECSNLQELNLSSNALRELKDGAFNHLAKLKTLSLASNEISAIGDSAFSTLEGLSKLDLSFNHIDWVIEDETSKGRIFSDLGNLHSLGLRGNRIRSISAVAFAPLKDLRSLDLSYNPVASIQENPFIDMTWLESLKLNTTNMVCDCSMKWFPEWLNNTKRIKTEEILAKCFHPVEQRGVDVTDPSLTSATCSSFPRLRIEESPQATVGLSGSNVTLKCRAKLTADEVDTSNDLIKFTWKKDKVPLALTSVQSDSRRKRDVSRRQWLLQARRMKRALARSTKKSGNFLLDGEPDSTSKRHSEPGVRVSGAQYFQEVYEQIADDGGLVKTSVLSIVNISQVDAGRYQCIVSNGIDSLYSKKVRVLVHEKPKFTKFPKDVTASLGQSAKLECEAEGSPNPQVSWKKDGGRHFPAAMERRMNRYPGDSDIFITEVKVEDEGVYTCTANSSAGMISANATLRIIGKYSFTDADVVKEKNVVAGDTAIIECRAEGKPRPSVEWSFNDRILEPTERHMFTHDGQILLIVNAQAMDAGVYKCSLPGKVSPSTATRVLNIAAPKKDGDWAVTAVVLSGVMLAFVTVVVGVFLAVIRFVKIKAAHNTLPRRMPPIGNMFELDAMLPGSGSFQMTHQVSAYHDYHCSPEHVPGDEIPVPFGLEGVATATIPEPEIIVPDHDMEQERRQFALMDDESDRASSKDSGTGTDSGANVSATGSGGANEPRMTTDYASAQEVLRSLRESLFVNGVRGGSVNVLSPEGGGDRCAKGREENPCVSPSHSPCTSPVPRSNVQYLHPFSHHRCESSTSVDGLHSPTRWSLPPPPDEEVPILCHEVSRSQMTSPVFCGGGGGVVVGGGGRSAYWGGHMNPGKFRRRGAYASGRQDATKSGMVLALPRTESSSSATNFSYGFGVSSPDLSQEGEGEFLKPPSLAGSGRNSATLKRGRLRASGTSLNSIGAAPKGKQVECPTVPPLKSSTEAPNSRDVFRS